MNQSYAKYLIEKTKQDFNKIAESFSKTRTYLWPELKKLKRYIQSGQKILDLGCGNGRLFKLFENKNIKYAGIDFSEKLIKKAKEKYGNYFQIADFLNLPFPDDYFDSIWAIAVFHHVPSEKLRLKTLQEINRVLNKDGKIILTCWNLYQVKYLKLLLKSYLSKFFKKSKLDYKDVLIPWKNTKTKRYYHAFTKKELKRLFKKAGFQIETLKYLKRNKKRTNILIVAKNSER